MAIRIDTDRYEVLVAKAVRCYGCLRGCKVRLLTQNFGLFQWGWRCLWDPNRPHPNPALSQYQPIANCRSHVLLWHVVTIWDHETMSCDESAAGSSHNLVTALTWLCAQECKIQSFKVKCPTIERTIVKPPKFRHFTGGVISQEQLSHNYCIPLIFSQTSSIITAKSYPSSLGITHVFILA